MSLPTLTDWNWYRHTVDLEELKAGDHIYTYNTGLFTSNHGIYVGKSFGGPKVLHLSWENSEDDNSVRIRLASLDEFRETTWRYYAVIRKYRYGVPELECQIKRRGTCCCTEADPSEVVLARAWECYRNGLPRESGHLRFSNNEQFALYCTLGEDYGTIQKYDQTKRLFSFW
ncbi:uncharacterized protein LOC144438653 [Glandiceps talaboti]